MHTTFPIQTHNKKERSKRFAKEERRDDIPFSGRDSELESTHGIDEWSRRRSRSRQEDVETSERYRTIRGRLCIVRSVLVVLNWSLGFLWHRHWCWRRWWQWCWCWFRESFDDCSAQSTPQLLNMRDILLGIRFHVHLICWQGSSCSLCEAAASWKEPLGVRWSKKKKRESRRVSLREMLMLLDAKWMRGERKERDFSGEERERGAATRTELCVTHAAMLWVNASQTVSRISLLSSSEEKSTSRSRFRICASAFDGIMHAATGTNSRSSLLFFLPSFLSLLAFPVYCSRLDPKLHAEGIVVVLLHGLLGWRKSRRTLIWFVSQLPGFIPSTPLLHTVYWCRSVTQNTLNRSEWTVTAARSDCISCRRVILSIISDPCLIPESDRDVRWRIVLFQLTLSCFLKCCSMWFPCTGWHFSIKHHECDGAQNYDPKTFQTIHQQPGVPVV